MKRVATFATAVLLSCSAAAENHSAIASEVRDTVVAFNTAYEEDEVDTYFDYYAPDATVYFDGVRQDLAAYEAEWTAMVAAGGTVEKNELSDIKVQVLPGGDAAVVSYFVDYRLRTPDGETSSSRAYESDVWQKADGKWRIVNLHYSGIPETE